jgi:hypothetical protein
MPPDMRAYGPDAYRVAFSLFVGLERGEGVLEDFLEAYDTHELLLGMGIVAAVLRHRLREHADRLGCDCGSDDWLECERLNLAKGD